MDCHIIFSYLVRIVGTKTDIQAFNPLPAVIGDVNQIYFEQLTMGSIVFNLKSILFVSVELNNQTNPVFHFNCWQTKKDWFSKQGVWSECSEF